MDEPSRAEYASIEKSLAQVRANGSTSYTRKYRSTAVAAKIGQHLADASHGSDEVYVLTLRNGEAVLVVDMCEE